MKKFAKCCIFLLCIVLIIVLAATIFVIITIGKIPDKNILDLHSLSLYNSQYEIFDAQNQHISSNSSFGKETVALSTLPQYVPDAFVSIEDKTFYQHNGLNVGRIVKASVTNLFSGYAKEGASTITQQLIKNIYLSKEKTMSRKIQEAYLALKLEKKYSKEEILETYLNAIYFGNGAFGIENASKSYFGKSATQLTLGESAILAGLIKSPKYYSPIHNPDNCLTRRNLVLKNMLADGKITESQYSEAVESPIEVAQNSNYNNDYIEEILREAGGCLNLNERDVSRSGYRIYTSIDSDLQQMINREKSLTKQNSAVIIDNQSGKIVAMFGDVSIKRQPASTIKPFLCYAPNLERGTLSPATPILDTATNFAGFAPHNANAKFLGWTDVRTALSQSLNVPAVKALSFTDVDYAMQLAKDCGFNLTDEDRNLATALGATRHGTAIRDVAGAYSVLGNQGVKKLNSLITKITDADGKEVYRAPSDTAQILSSETAYLLTDMLKTCVQTGTAKKLNSLSIPALSAKTGTVGSTIDSTNLDAWCVSFTPEFTVLSWFGNTTADTSQNLSKTENGGTIATRQNAKLWRHILRLYPETSEFVCPETVQSIPIDTLSLEQQKLERASKNTPEKYTKTELFNTQFLPRKVSENFDIITLPELILSKAEDGLKLGWEGEEIYIYEVYSICQNKEKLIERIEGRDNSITISLPLPTITTSYYLKISLKNNPQISQITEQKQYYIASYPLTYGTAFTLKKKNK